MRYVFLFAFSAIRNRFCLAWSAVELRESLLCAGFKDLLPHHRASAGGAALVWEGLLNYY